MVPDKNNIYIRVERAFIVLPTLKILYVIKYTNIVYIFSRNYWTFLSITALISKLGIL